MAKARKNSVDNIIAECNSGNVRRKRAIGKLDIISLSYDIAGRKGIERKILKVNEELEQRLAERTVELEKAYKRLKQEVKERKQVEKALRDSEQRFNALFEGAQDGIIAVNAKGEFLYANKAVAENLGYTKDEFLKLNITDIEAKESKEEFEEHYADMLEGKRLRFETLHKKKDGSVIYVDVSLNVFDFRGEKITYTVLRDITDRKRAEKKLAVYHQQLQSLASEMSLLEERQRRNIAAELHDRIGQSLNLVRLKLESARKSAASGDLSGNLDEINTMVGHIIDDTHSLEFELSPPLLYELGMEEAVGWFLEQIQAVHGIQSVLEIDKEHKPYLSTSLCIILFRAVQELLNNVVKHARASTVRVSIKQRDNTLRVIVADDGAGFETSQGQVRISKNGGFGLFSIREQLKYFDGDLDIKSKIGCGTVITITVPIND